MIAKLLNSELATTWIQVLGHSLWVGTLLALAYFIYLKVGGITPDGRIRVKEIRTDSVLLEDLDSRKEQIVKKQSSADFKTYFAELSIRGGENFFVKEGTDFYLPGDQETKWRMISVTDRECLLLKADQGGATPIAFPRKF